MTAMGSPAVGTSAKKRIDKVPQLLAAIKAHSDSVVSLGTLAAEGGYVPGTLKTYVMKNKLAPFVVWQGAGQCQVGNTDSLDLGPLRRALSQKENRYAYEHLGFTELVSSLIERSRTNAGLALELINRPELPNRLDAFLLLFVTAWEQLLKAGVEHSQVGGVFTGTQSASGRPTTITLAKAIEQTWPDVKSPIRRNLERLKDLRDNAAHLLVPEVVGIVSRYFQAGLWNYIDHFTAFVQEQPFRFAGTGLLTLGIAYSSPTLESLRTKHGRDAADIKALIVMLENSATNEDPKFVIPMKCELVLEKKPGPGAIRLTNGSDGVSVAMVKVPRDVKAAFPHTCTACAKLLSDRTGRTWSNNDVAQVATFLKVKEADNEHHYGFKYGKNTLHQYSDCFIDVVVQRLQQEPELVKHAREAARRRSK
jgi:hypothetical protein